MKKQNLTNPLNLKRTVIDSLRLRIPLQKVKLIDERLTSEYICYYPDIDAIDDDLQKVKPFVSEINGITVRIYIKSFRDGQKSENFIVFTMSAKMLKSNYFQGINLSNIQEVYNFLMDFRVFSCDYQTFQNALISDIDICYNTRLRRDLLTQAFQSIQKLIKPNLAKCLNIFNQKNNQGLELNTRQKGTPSVPYVKIYQKEIELLNKSVKFYKTYLEPLYITDLVRVEYNIKNAKHKKHLQKKFPEFEYTTLNDFLQLPQSLLNKILTSGIPQYITKLPKTNSLNDLSPTDMVLKYYIENLIALGFDEEKLLGFEYDFPLTPSGNVSKSRAKSKMRKLIKRITHKNYLEVKLNENGQLQEFYKQLNLNL